MLELLLMNYQNQPKQKYQYLVEQTPSRLTTEKKVLLSGPRHVQSHFLAEQSERKRNS